MINNIIKSVGIALSNMRGNPMHTLLSTLGIIIGIAALVAILSVGDGLEKFGRDQIGSTTSLQYLSVDSKLSEFKDGLRIPLEDRAAIQYADYENLKADNGLIQAVDLLADRSAVISLEGDTLSSPARLTGRTEGFIDFEDFSVTGRTLTKEDIANGNQVMVISKLLADKLTDSTRVPLGEYIQLDDLRFEIVGVIDAEVISAMPQAYFPLSLFNHANNSDVYPRIVAKAKKIEDVLVIKDQFEAYFDSVYAKAEFNVGTNEGRVKQLEQGILMFKLVMGMITGISVLVGGIGVMNVLLISIKDRTREIGIRKASGAKRTDILFQFLSESVTITFVGCIIGLLVGMLAVFAFAPLVNLVTNFEFPITFTISTIIVVLVIGFLIGIIFGTYPAWRASRLTPVEAIRTE